MRIGRHRHTARGLVLAGLVALSSAAAGVGYAAQPPNCQAGDLNAELGGVHYLSRVSFAHINLTAKPGVRCTLSGFSAGHQFFGESGERLPTEPNPGAPAQGPVTLTERSPANIRLDWENLYPEVRPATLRFTLPGASLPSSIAWPDGVSLLSGRFQHSAVAAGLGPEPESSH